MLQHTCLYVYMQGIHVHFPSQHLKLLSCLYADYSLKIKIQYKTFSQSRGNGGSGIPVILESLENKGVLCLPIK